MPFDRPEMQTLIIRTVTDINSRFLEAGNVMRRKATKAFARVLAGMAHGLYGNMEWVSRQILPDTQDEDILLRFGAVHGVSRIAGDYARGNVTATGTNGSVIETGSLWQRADGVVFVTQSSAVIASGSATVTLKAEEIGADWNTASGETIDLVSPIAGVNSSAIVDEDGLAGGLDVETIAAYRRRVLRRTASYFTGANAAVYRQWALEVSGVTRAWVYENSPAPGSVTLLFVCDDIDPIFPDSSKIAAVADYIEEHVDPNTGVTVGRAVNVTMTVAAPTEKAINFTITPTPNTTSVRTAIEAELSALLSQEGEPGGTIPLSRINEAISFAKGEVSHVLSSPVADVTCDDDEIPTLGTITWP